MSEKMAVLAPMPSAMVRIAVRVKPGDLRGRRGADETCILLLRLRGLHDEGNGGGEPRPARGFRLQTLAAFGGELIEAGAAIALRCAPFCIEHAAQLHAMERGIERALFDA